MPLRKAAIVLLICAMGLALLFHPWAVRAQSCSLPPTCSCGSAVCDEYGNCSCPNTPSCDCGTAYCSNSQWRCDEAPACDDCYVPVCGDGSWTCEYDGSSCSGGGGGGGETLPCNNCDPDCPAYNSLDASDGNCMLM